MKLTIQFHTRQGITTRSINTIDEQVFDVHGAKLILTKGNYYFCNTTKTIKFTRPEVRLNDLGEEVCEYTGFVQVGDKAICAGSLWNKTVENLKHFSTQIPEDGVKEIIRQSKLTSEEIAQEFEKRYQDKQKANAERDKAAREEREAKERKLEEVKAALFEENKKKFKNFEWVEWDFVVELANKVGYKIPARTKGWADKNVDSVVVRDENSISFGNRGKTKSASFVVVVIDLFKLVK